MLLLAQPLVTGGLLAYKGLELENAGYNHQRHVTSGDSDELKYVGHAHLGVSLLKRWLGSRTITPFCPKARGWWREATPTPGINRHLKLIAEGDPNVPQDLQPWLWNRPQR